MAGVVKEEEAGVVEEDLDGVVEEQRASLTTRGALEED